MTHLGCRLFLSAFILSWSLHGLIAQPQAQPPPAAPSWPAASPEAIDRWRALRFGMFLHWGPVSLTGKEIGWSRGAQTPVEVYDNLYKSFNPANFHADEWASIAKAVDLPKAPTNNTDK